METLWKEVEGSVYSDESIPRPGPTPMRCVDTDEPFENIKMSFRLFLGQWHSVSKPAHATPATRAGRPGLAAAQLGEGTPGRGAPLRGACGAAQWWRANGTRAGQDGMPPGPGTSCLRVDLRKGRASRWLMAITLVGRGERLRR